MILPSGLRALNHRDYRVFFAGQAVALVASGGAGVLAWTGLALAWRRFRGWRRRVSTTGALASSARPGQEVSAD